MTVKTRKPLKQKKLIIILSIILAIALALTASAVIFVKVGELKLRDKLTFQDGNMDSDDAYGDNEEVFHNGQSYVYNENLINILCVGVDKENYTDKSDRQADALYLLSLDTQANTLNVLAISRNTLADIDIYDMNDEYMATENRQICLSYAYGKNDKQSTVLTCKAVSRFLYDIPINAYYTVFMDTIGDIVNAVGGVEVVIPSDMRGINKEWHKGKRVTLKGKYALHFLQYRDESNEPRLERQKMFISNFVTSAKKAFKKDLTIPAALFKKLSKNSVTDIDASQVTYLATEMANASFKMNSILGKSGFDGTYETFEADEDALYQTVLNLFYIKTN